jgi:hypothetical protein
MSRVYRSALNGKIPVDELSKLIFVLNTIRQAIMEETQGQAQQAGRAPINLQIVVTPSASTPDYRQIEGDAIRIEPPS